jgi:hypothetical protein
LDAAKRVMTEFHRQAIALKWGADRLDSNLREFFRRALDWAGLQVGGYVVLEAGETEKALEELLVTGASEEALSEQQTTASRHRGPRPDTEGHMRVAELLPDGWEDDLKGSLQRLAEPEDGGPAVLPSPQWQREYNISSYAEAFESISDKAIKQHLSRRRDLGIDARNSRQLSETVVSHK